jgi:hypothetical protein
MSCETVAALFLRGFSFNIALLLLSLDVVNSAAPHIQFSSPSRSDVLLLTSTFYMKYIHQFIHKFIFSLVSIFL